MRFHIANTELLYIKVENTYLPELNVSLFDLKSQFSWEKIETLHHFMIVPYVAMLVVYFFNDVSLRFDRKMDRQKTEKRDF